MRAYRITGTGAVLVLLVGLVAICRTGANYLPTEPSQSLSASDQGSDLFIRLNAQAHPISVQTPGMAVAQQSPGKDSVSAAAYLLRNDSTAVRIPAATVLADRRHSQGVTLPPRYESDRFTQSDHGGSRFPTIPTITHFGILGRGSGNELFYFTVEGPAGAPYFLETSTDQKNWERSSQITTMGEPEPGGPGSPSAFIPVSSAGERYFVRLILP